MIQLPNLTILTLNTPNITDFAAERNELLKSATTEWVLFLDTDESLSPALEQEIQNTISNPQNSYSAYLIPRLDTFMGKQLRHGETGKAKFVRLAKKDFGKWERPIHEIWIPVGARRGSPVKIGTLRNPLIHNSHPIYFAINC